MPRNKKKFPISEIILLISLIIFGGVLFWTLIFEPDVSTLGLLVIVLLLTLSVISAIASSITLIIKNIKDAKKYRKKSQDVIIVLWKWINILSVGAIIILIASSAIKKENWFVKQWIESWPQLSPLLINLWIVISLILSIVVVYGIQKRKVIGYYTSLVQIALITLSYIIYSFRTEGSIELGFFLIPILLYILLGSFIYKNKKYFNEK